MSRKAYALVAGFVAAGASVWWWRTRATIAPVSDVEPRVIFDNTPLASSPDGSI